MLLLRFGALMLALRCGVYFTEDLATDPWWWTALEGIASLVWFNAMLAEVPA